LHPPIEPEVDTPMPRRPTSLALIALAGLLVAGCGGGGSQTQSTGPPATGTSSKASSTAPASEGQPGAAGQAQVRMKNIKFVPESITVKKGQTVKWVNDDGVAHTVTADSGDNFDSGTVAAGGTYQHKFTKPGRVHYFCTIHGQQQSGTVTVTG
jgi:plastocyanin